MTTIAHWISGTATSGASTRTAPVLNPATGQQQASVLMAEQADVDAAVAAARKGFEEWRDVSLTRRARMMFAFRQLVDKYTGDLARIVASEHGKVVSDARGEVIRGMEVVEYACGLPELLKGEYSDQVSTPDVDLFSFRQPLGVCAGITPFNFPVMVPMWMHPMAIACGNAFVPQAVGARPTPRRTSSPSCTPMLGFRTVSSTSSTATRSRSTQSSTIRTLMRSRSSAHTHRQIRP